MISTLLSLYAAGVLTMGSDATIATHSMLFDGVNLESTAIAQKKGDEIAPLIKAKAAIAVDLENGLILYEKNIYEPLPIASITKLMTAIIILEENNLKDTVTVSKTAAKTEGTKMWLAAGEKISVENLLYSILIPSANDAATALAEFNSGDDQKFAEKMNKKALEIGLLSTSFINPTGLDNIEPAPPETAIPKKAPESVSINPLALFFNETAPSGKQTKNLSTAYDLTLLGRYAYGKSFLRRAVIKKEMEIQSVDGNFKHKIKSTNELLDSYLKVLGLKTGTTDEAGECLVSIIENDQGHDILTVVLNSPQRYTETKILADWVFRAYDWN